jgi:hypothetical protein
MNVFKKSMILAGCIAALGLGAATAMAQPGGGANGFGGGAGGGRGRGGFGMDPAQLRSDMEVKDDAEWTAISAKITAVQTAQQAANNRGGRGRGNRGNRGVGAGGAATAPATPLADAVAELQKAYDANAPTAEIKDKMAKVQDLRKSARAELLRAQDELRALLTSRQEAYLMLNTTYLN